jgi:hypothetical protein
MAGLVRCERRVWSCRKDRSKGPSDECRRRSKRRVAPTKPRLGKRFQLYSGPRSVGLWLAMTRTSAMRCLGQLLFPTGASSFPARTGYWTCWSLLLSFFSKALHSEVTGESGWTEDRYSCLARAKSRENSGTEYSRSTTAVAITCPAATSLG